jgi:hypothetical protein
MLETSQFIGQSTDHVMASAVSSWAGVRLRRCRALDGWVSSGKLQGAGNSLAMLRTHDMS